MNAVEEVCEELAFHGVGYILTVSVADGNVLLVDVEKVRASAAGGVERARPCTCTVLDALASPVLTDMPGPAPGRPSCTGEACRG